MQEAALKCCMILYGNNTKRISDFMILEWLKKNKGTPLFKLVVILLILFLLRFGLVIYNKITNDDVKSASYTAASEDEESRSVWEQILHPENEDGEEEPLFDIHIGWSNIVIFAGLAIALAVIERRKNMSVEHQQTIKYRSEDNDDKEDNDESDEV